MTIVTQFKYTGYLDCFVEIAFSDKQSLDEFIVLNPQFHMIKSKEVDDSK